jgi:hypothetical protein
MGRVVKGQQKHSNGTSLQGEMTSPDCPLTNKSAKTGFAEATGIIHHVLWEHPSVFSVGSRCK